MLETVLLKTPTVGGSRSRNSVPAPVQPPQEARDARGGLVAPMAFMSWFSRNGSRAPVQRIHDDTVSHPILSVFELERLLYTGKTACNHADEVWPGLYLGDQKDPGSLCSGGEQISHPGPCLPHDLPPTDLGGSHKDRQGPPGHHTQPRFPSPAGRPGQFPQVEAQTMSRWVVQK
ncbi:hypothetical protein JD844_031244 [Phrynosoma platyrhinos]|uniref:Uncharacterized protein n=1 Tax=Phrynosoma platyrhinos TaxID=52577 RepID=A0ABQ7T0R5_PHRPL|nr:hypothetical protein JD844_031244 [Phrynosoma platyrhinos]